MLRRRLSLLQAVSLNMAMMVGIGPFITIPEFLKKLDGPQVMIGWVIGALIALADGLVWSELAAAFPGSGGTFHFYDAIYGDSKAGRLLKFLFVWQFLFSAPLEVATGAIGLAHYVGYFWPALKQTSLSLHLLPASMTTKPWVVLNEQWLAMGVMVLITTLAYRRIEVAGRLMVVLWAGMLATVSVVILTGLSHFDAQQAFAFPKDAFNIDRSFLIGLGGAVGIAMYDFLGYYQICYLGDEVEDAPRNIPRAILISVIAIGLIYLTMNISILGVLPWEMVTQSTHVASDMMNSVFGSTAAQIVTGMIVWTAGASTFAAMLGYSRVPYAAARSGHFFQGLARTHPSGDFPHRSLLLVGGLATLACLADLVTVIEALLTSRILIQFVGQIATVFYLRSRPDLNAKLRFRMTFFPIPALIALIGWLYIFGTSRPEVIAYGLGSLGLGVLFFLAWSRSSERQLA